MISQPVSCRPRDGLSSSTLPTTSRFYYYFFKGRTRLTTCQLPASLPLAQNASSSSLSPRLPTLPPLLSLSPFPSSYGSSSASPFPYKAPSPPNGSSHSSSFSPMPPLLLLLLSLRALAAQAPTPNPCGEGCGALPLPFPFHLNASCGPPVPAFRLSCSSGRDPALSLSLPLLSDLRVLAFLPSGSLLLDYSSPSSSSSCDRWYADVNHSFGLDGSPFFAVTADNLLRLYDCEDSSICRAGCDRIGAAPAGCEGNRTDFGCCYPLSDGSVWKVGNGFSLFAEFGCRGFSSWAVVTSASGDGTLTAERGIEVEWAVPRAYGNGTECAAGAVAVNATAVRGGVRCACAPGFVGDGFAGGAGCFKCELLTFKNEYFLPSLNYNDERK